MTNITLCDECGKEVKTGIRLFGRLGFGGNFRSYDLCVRKCFTTFVMKKFKLEKKAGVKRFLW